MEQIQVENIKCDGCAGSIEHALRKVPGVTAVDVDIKNNVVFVEGHADRQRLLDELSRLGYPEKGSNTIMCKARSYFNCAWDKIT